MIKNNLKFIQLWPTNLKIIMISSFFLLICTLGYSYIVRSAFKEKEKAYFCLKHLNNELNEQHYKIQEFYKHNKISNTSKKINLFFNKNNSNYIFRIIMGQLFSSFYINQLYISSIKKNYFFNAIEIKSSFLSFSDDIIKFINLISKSNHFIIIRNFKWILSTFRSSVKKDNKNFLFTVYTLYARKDSFLSAIDKKNKKFDKLIVFKKTNLIKYDLASLKLVGFLSKNRNNEFALVELLNGQILKVKIGDSLGLEQFTVVGIYNREILIQDNTSNKIKIIKLKMKNRKFSYAENDT